MPSSLQCLRAALFVFSERSARRAGASGSPRATGSAWIRRNRRELSNPGSGLWGVGRGGREAADKGELCELWEWRQGVAAVRSVPGAAVPPVASRQRRPAPQGARLFYKNLKPAWSGSARYSCRLTRSCCSVYLPQLTAIPHPPAPSSFFWGGRRLNSSGHVWMLLQGSLGGLARPLSGRGQTPVSSLYIFLPDLEAAGLVPCSPHRGES